MHAIRLMRTAAAIALATVAFAAPAPAQQYPSGDIRLVSAFAAGSGADVLVRYFAEKLRPIAGRTVIVENKPGAGGNVATEYTVRSKPDGHVIFVHAGNTLASNFHLIRNNPVDARTQIQVAATINRQAFMLVVDPKQPWKTVAELTAAMKQKGDKASYATGANSGVIMCAIHKELAGLESVDVPYKMAQDSLNDMASGRVDYACHDPQFALSQMREGRLRILAVASADRLVAAPDYPSMKEAGYPMDLVGWFSAMVPAGTPRPVVDQINAWFRQIHADPETKRFLNSFGGDPWVATPEEAQARLLTDIKNWEEYVRIAKLKPQG
jgi:tripartite-type tricarboxylate transporter receptor subunit TctC